MDDSSLNALWMELFLFYKNPLDHKNSNLAMSRRDREAITKGAFGKEGCVFNPRKGGRKRSTGVKFKTGPQLLAGLRKWKLDFVYKVTSQTRKPH